MVAFNDSHGIRAGYVIGFPRFLERGVYGIGLSTRRSSQMEVDRRWVRIGRDAELMTTIAHLPVLTLPHGDHVRAFTPRQREVLQLVADGRTIQDVALLFGRNHATEEKHLRLRRKALGVETTAQAILKVSLLNRFITLDPGSADASAG